MYIPSAELQRLPGTIHDALLVYTVSKSGSSDKIEKWSTLIGVVTAICGNILISFALNTQRYAHMRLSHDREEREEKVRAGRKKSGTRSSGYGTAQEEVAERRARVNAKDEPQEYSLLESGNATSERQPLIPKMGTRSASAMSEATAQEESDGDEVVKEKSYMRSPIWWAGITMMTVGEAGNFLAYGFAPASLVSPLGVVALISNCLIAPLLLHERFRWRDALGVVIAVTGCVTVVLSASDSNPKLTQKKIWTLITQWEFETYMGISIFLIVVLSVASNRFGDRTVLIDLGLVALFGGYTALSTKGVASLLSNTIWRVVTFPITYLLVAVLVFTAVMQIKYLNRALQRFNATVVIPTQFVLFTISVILGSAILYRDFERTTSEDAAKFIGGCALTFSGVWCITSGRSKDSGDDHEEISGDEDGDEIDLTEEEEVQPEVCERSDDGDRRQSVATADGPSFRRSHTTDLASLAQGLSSTPPTQASSQFAVGDSPLKPMEHLIPANAAAIHERPTFHGSGEQNGNHPTPPRMHATTSAPVVPTTSSTRPRTPHYRRTSVQNPEATGTPLPRRSLPSENLEPPSSHRLINKHSMVGLFPAPFTSPLSNSLSAIVAESLRRGVDQQASVASVRRRLGRSKSGRGSVRPEVPKYLSALDAVRTKRHSIASGDMPFDEVANVRDSAAQSSRMRSLSATVSDIFGGSSKRPRIEGRETMPERWREEEEQG